MRITNKIMENNSLYNINQNKVLQDKLSTQMSTQKKLTRPSDDPVVAIRALRLRSSVSEITQYSKRNAEDAKSWLQVTADGLGTVNEILTDLNKNANKGANKDLTADDLDIIITQMKSLTGEFYSTGNLDYAGRYVFTGYRTDTPMSFTAADVANVKEPIPPYKITEQIKIGDFDTVNYTDISKLDGLTQTNYSSHNEVEQNIKNTDVRRLRLSYDKLKDPAADITIDIVKSYTGGVADIDSTSIGAIPKSTEEAAYKAVLAANESDTEVAFFIPETGEIIFSDKFYENKFANNASIRDNTELRISYEKEKWENGDLRPEHYFACTSAPGTADSVDYNQNYLTEKGKEKQVIAYDVGYNQTIEINTTADEVFNHALSRDIDDLNAALNDLKDIEKIRDVMKNELASKTETDADYEDTKNTLDSINKAYTYIRENIHDMLQRAITKTQKYLDDSNVAVTDNGTRSSRLELISNRLIEQKTTFETLKSENEDVDIAEVAVELSGAKLTYEASLTATSKIMQTTLMNYI